MSGRKAVIGLTMLCALLVSAFAAQAASAVGTTAYTCTSGAGTAVGENFSDAHCKTHSAGGAVKHVAIPNGTVTNFTANDITTGTTHSGAELRSTVAGSAIAVHANEVTGSGTMSNSEVGGEMIASGEGKLKYTGVTETLLGCEVIGIPGGAGVIETNNLAGSTAGVGDKVKVSAKAGAGVLAEFELKNCIIGPTVIRVFGSVNGVPDGATTNTVHNTVTAEKTLRLQNATTGPVAGIEGTLTISANGNPLSVTT